MRRSLGFFGRITWVLLFSKETDPHLGPWQNQKQRSKELNFAFFLKKKSFYPNKSHFCRSVCFSVSWYKLKESTGTAGLQHEKVKLKDPATNLDHGKLKFKAPAAAPAASPGAGEVKPQAPAASPAILVPRKNKAWAPVEAWNSRWSHRPQRHQLPAWSPTEMKPEAPGSSCCQPGANSN